MDLARIATYLPSWSDPSGRPVAGPDEDVLTLAVAAGEAALGTGDRAEVRRIVLVSAHPDFLEGSPASLLPAALSISVDTPVEQRLGGADAALDAIATGSPGTLVLAVDAGTPAAAGAVLLVAGDTLSKSGSHNRSMPVVVHAAGKAEPTVYDDPRLLRERGWKVAVEAVAGGTADTLVVGVPAAAAAALGSGGVPGTLGLTGAAAAVFALASLAESGAACRLVAVDAGSATAVDVAGLTTTVVRAERPRQPLPSLQHSEGEIPVSVAALDRAQDAKIGFLGAQCACGHVEFPPRLRCPACGSESPTTAVPLGRTGEVYTTVTIHAPVPGMATPYAVAIVELDDPSLRVLAPVADTPPNTLRIGQRGRMVFRRVAVRQGIPDYMHAFQPALEEEMV